MILLCAAAGGIVAGWTLPDPASWVGILMAAVSIGGMAVLRSDLIAETRKEERARMRRELRERSERGDPQE